MQPCVSVSLQHGTIRRGYGINSTLRPFMKARRPERHDMSKEKRERRRTIGVRSFVGTFTQRQRRASIYAMKLQGYTIREMAKELSAGVQTIVNDLRSMEAALNETIDTTQGNAILNETLADLEAGRVIALRGLRNSKGNERIGYLNSATKISEVKIALLQNAGLLPTATRKLQHAGPDGGLLPTVSGVTVVIHTGVSREEEEGEPLPPYVIHRLADKAEDA